MAVSSIQPALSRSATIQVHRDVQPFAATETNRVGSGAAIGTSLLLNHQNDVVTVRSLTEDSTRGKLWSSREAGIVLSTTIEQQKWSPAGRPHRPCILVVLKGLTIRLPSGNKQAVPTHDDRLAG